MAEESKAVRVAREFREQLARNEDAALRRMSRYWVRMERELEPQFIALAQQIKEMEDSGQVVPPQYYYSLQRYQDLMAQILREVPDYEKYAVDIITDYQTENFNLGLDDASAVISASKPSDAMWNRVDRDAVQTVAGFAGNGAPLGELMRHDYGDLGAKVTDALVQGIGLGKGVSAIARDMRDAMGMEYNRSVRIARTEVNRAYRIANAMQYEKSGVVTKVLRLAYKPTACFACLMLDGQECPKGICDDHPNGKCTTVAVTVGGIYPEWQRGEQWLMEQSENDQRKIIGDGRFEMWKNDGVPLRDMVEMKPNAVWGGSPTVISEKELRERYNITGGNKTLFSAPVQNVAQQATPKSYLSDTFQKKLDGIEFRACKDLAKAETQDQVIATVGGGDQTKGSCASVALAYVGRSNGIDVLDFRDGKSRDFFAKKYNTRDMASECGIIHKMVDDFSKTGWEKLKSADLEDDVEYLLSYACHMSVIRKNGNNFEYLELQSNWRNGWNKLNAKKLKSRFGASDSGRFYKMDIYDVRSYDGDKFKEVLGYLNTAPGKERKGKGGTIK